MNIHIPDEEIINKLVMNNSQEQVFEFVRDIDMRMASYDFTEKLRNYFVSEIEKEDKILP